MTTAPVMSITDELIAELEAAARGSIYGCPTWLERDGYSLSCADASDVNHIVTAAPSVILALLAEREELKRNYERLQFVISEGITISSMNGTGRPMVYQCQWHDCRQIDWYASPTEAIDAAMQTAQ